MVAASPITQSSVHTSLATELPVSSSATTSRVLVMNDVLRVVQFTFDAGERLTEHTSPRAVVCQLIEGTMTFTVAGRDSTLDAGDVVYLAPGEAHALVAETPCRLALTMVDVDALGADHE